MRKNYSKNSPIGLETIWNIKDSVDWTFKDVYIPVSVITKACKVNKDQKMRKNAEEMWKNVKKYSNTHQ